jgi:hypothetical protein
MNTGHAVILSVYTAFSVCNGLCAQDSTQSCRVEQKSLVGTYTGECKKGLANGKGEATGYDHYTGLFKNGWPDGKGVYYYRDGSYYDGNFQEGIKEGKGEMHFIRAAGPDSVVKGYWSGDEYRGKKYITYHFDGEAKFDLYEMTPSSESGNTIVFEISTTSGSPDGTKGNFMGSSGYVLKLDNLVSINGNIIKKISDFSSANKYTATYEADKFPTNLYVMLSDGKSFNLELYKSANWKIRLYLNK